jgi:hypothetical protein
MKLRRVKKMIPMRIFKNNNPKPKPQRALKMSKKPMRDQDKKGWNNFKNSGK